MLANPPAALKSRQQKFLTYKFVMKSIANFIIVNKLLKTIQLSFKLRYKLVRLPQSYSILFAIKKSVKR